MKRTFTVATNDHVWTGSFESNGITVTVENLNTEMGEDFLGRTHGYAVTIKGEITEAEARRELDAQIDDGIFENVHVRIVED